MMEKVIAETPGDKFSKVINEGDISAKIPPEKHDETYLLDSYTEDISVDNYKKPNAVLDLFKKFKARAKHNKNDIDIDSYEQQYQNEDCPVSLPTMLLLGFQEGTNKKDVLTYLNSKANDLLMVDITYFNIVKADGGYYWELQEGGSGKGVLTSVISGLKSQNELAVRTSSKSLRIVKRKNNPGFDSFLTTEDETIPQSEQVKFADKMKPISSKGTGFLLFGTIFFAFSIIFLLLAFLFKFGLLNRSQEVQVVRNVDSTPYTQHKKMLDILNLKTIYIDQLVLDNSGKYLIKTLNEETDPNQQEGLSSSPLEIPTSGAASASGEPQ